MRARLPWSPAPGDEHPLVQPLGVEAARHVRVPWLSRFNSATLRDHLARYPGHSLWFPASGEYVVGSPWRSREDIAELVEVTARRGKRALVQSSIDLMRTKGYSLLLLTEEVWASDARTYLDLGFQKRERIVFFNRELRQAANITIPELPDLKHTRANVEDLDLLVRLDHNSFPWLWWNSLEEMEIYMQMPDVHIYVARDVDKPVGYSSFTMYKGWAHLDRLAVILDEQGKGFGAAQLRHVLDITRNLGAQSINLSTQEDNVRSHRLYRSFGFRQTSEKMSFYGLDL